MTTNQTDVNCKLEMPAELKQRWLEALRSGRYKQTKEYLCVTEEQAEDVDSDFYGSDAGYCCLGVLAHIIDGTTEAADNANGLPSDGWYKANGLASFFAAETCDPTGYNRMMPTRNDCVLFHRNDGYYVYGLKSDGKTDYTNRTKMPAMDFLQIADYIEANVKAL